MATLLDDLRYGARMLAKNPGFTAAAVACLGLGMGATTAIFSIVQAVLLKPLPYTASGELVRLYSEFPTFPNGGLRRFWISAPEYLELKRETSSWAALDGWVSGGANLAGAGEPIRVVESYVTGGLMPSLGVRPLLGRVIQPHDDVRGAPLVAVLSHGLWRRAYGGDPRVIGRDIRHDGTPCTVIGVMPPGFAFPPGEVDAPELWVPLRLDPANPGNRGGHYLSIVGRLKPGVSLRRAQEELAARVNQWGERAGRNFHTFHPKFHPIVSFAFRDEVVRAVRPAMLVLLGAVAFVLMIACVNVANLLLARAESRKRETAVRAALGAGFPRLLRQFVTEGLLLAFCGAAVGLVLAYGGVRLIAATNAGSIPRSAEIAIDTSVLGFVLAVSVGTGVFFGLSPLAHSSPGRLAEILKTSGSRVTGGRSAQALRRALVMGELALALVLLIGCGLMLRTFWKLREVDTGIRPAGVLTMRLSLPAASYAKAADLVEFWGRLQQRLRALPGAQAASLISGLPPARPINANDTEIENFQQVPGGPIQNVDYWQVAGAGYFETMGIRLIEGRLLDERDGANAPPAVVINQAMARHFWKNESPLGKRVRTGTRDAWRTIVGVVADVKNAGVDRPAGTELYFPYAQTPGANGIRTSYVLLRGSGDSRSLASAARAAIRELDPALPVSNVRTMDEVLAAAQSRPRFLSLMLALFSGVALALAAVGVYGVISYSVAQRTGEIGVRMALGARRADVLRMVLAQGARLGLAGVALGAASAAALTRLMRSLLFGTDAFDPGTFVLMAALLSAVTLLACLVPARRATRVDPMAALRYE